MLSCSVRNLNRRRTPSDQIAFAVHVDPVRRPLRVCYKKPRRLIRTFVPIDAVCLYYVVIVMPNGITIYESRSCTYSTKPAYLITNVKQIA